ncbi:homoaconitase LysF [Diplocarpon rosae]|nr:homoaconitase LysF [Diplocarpon rosae]
MRTTILAGRQRLPLRAIVCKHKTGQVPLYASKLFQCRRQLSISRPQQESKAPLSLVETAQCGKRKRSNKLRILLSLAVLTALATAIVLIADPNNKEVKKIFDAPRFTPFTIVKREEVSPTSIILTLRPQTLVNRPRKLLDDPYQACREKGTWSVEFKQPDLQIARSYTPLPPKKGDPKGDLRFLIRREHKGEVSGYLHTLGEGSQVQLRGPHEEFSLPESVQDVLFLAGGTGIAPALQVAHTLLEARDTQAEKSKIHIVWASRKRADCEGGVDSSNPNAWEAHKTGKIVQELELLQQSHPGQLSVDYLVDEEGKCLDQKRISSLTMMKTKARSGAAMADIDSQLLFVSGPEGFISYVAGPKRWEHGREGQGELGGILRKMGLKTWKVWKL